jgi:antitoxin (DNA-binding transcriptional repressor) of toxin-antitoxin stability system
LVEHLTPGDEVVITKDGRPVAKLVASAQAAPRPVYGRGKDQLLFWIDDDEHLKDFAEYM